MPVEERSSARVCGRTFFRGIYCLPVEEDSFANSAEEGSSASERCFIFNMRKKVFPLDHMEETSSADTHGRIIFHQTQTKCLSRAEEAYGHAEEVRLQPHAKNSSQMSSNLRPAYAIQREMRLEH